MAKQKTNTTPTTKAVTLEWVPFGDLVFLENNPRTRTEEGKRKMATDIERDPSFYENRPTLVNLIDGRYQVYGGDLRAHAAHDVLGWPLIPCNVEADVLPELMRSRAILDNTHRETWDADKLSEWGYEPEELEEMGVWLADGETAIEDLAGGLSGGADDSKNSENNYSKKIEAPIYEPKNEKPDYLSLFEQERTNELIHGIQAANIPQAEKDFLTLAAYRHTVFNYERIADFYAHSSPEVQKLMEDSALVIIDFQRAIELGYVKLSEEISKLYDEEYTDAE